MEDTKKLAFVLDVDGTLTDGKMYYTTEGKVMKAFGCDDWDALKTLSEKVEICFITGDIKGFDISKKRADEMKIPLFLVPSNAVERWDWIRSNFEDQKIIFMGDGINDYLSLRKADTSFTVVDALSHVVASAKMVIPRKGGDRAVAMACLVIDDLFNLKCFPEEVKWTSKR